MSENVRIYAITDHIWLPNVELMVYSLYRDIIAPDQSTETALHL